jgi:hypothetical protein
MLDQDLRQVALQTLSPLSDSERLEAREAARQYVIAAEGDKPRREQFQDVRVSEYPGWVNKLVALLMFVVFIVSAAPSLFRLYTAGRAYFLLGIGIEAQAAIVGLATFMLAETLVIISTIVMRIYFHGRARFVFIIPIAFGTAMALEGNRIIARPHDVFGWLETIAPPVAVLFMALIAERLILDSIRTRHANERAYQEALKQWQENTRDPETSPRWRSAYANALKEKIREINGRGRGKTERDALMAQLPTAVWGALVMRELRSESWFENLDADAAFEDVYPAQMEMPARPAIPDTLRTTQTSTVPVSEDYHHNGKDPADYR